MKTGFFDEAEGQQSATRLVFVIGMFWAMALCTFVAIKTSASPVEIAGMFSMVAGTLGAVKVGQKMTEQKPEEMKL